MKTELRIGNKILLGSSVVEVIEIWSDGLRVTNSGTGCGYTYDQFIPIALTEEWLERFGFVLTRNGLISDYPYWKKEREFPEPDFEVMIEGIEGLSKLKFWCGAWSGDHIRYVHQLQNLYFALTGEELTLKEIK